MKMNISVLLRVTIVLFFLGVIVNYACKKKEVLVKKLDPIFSEFYPNSGGPGTLITIEGENLEANLDAYKISIAENEADVVSVTKNKLVFMAPSKSFSGEIVVKHESSTKNIGKFTYQDLTIKGISPANGSSGTVIKIKGSGFAGELDPAKVIINEKELSVVSASDTVLYAEVPKGTGTGAVEVHVNGKESKGQSFRYQEILGVKPLKGGMGTRVTISGMGFELDKQNTVVDFNGKLAEVVEVSETQMVVIAPTEVKSGQITVAFGKLKLPGPIFTVTPKPIIEKVVPLSGPEDSEVTITGDFFSTIAEENKIYFNGVLAEITKVNQRELKVKIPKGASNGDISLAVNDQKVNWPDFLVQNLGLLNINPSNGISGEEITITGMGFSKNIHENKVFFNGVQANVKSANDTELKLNLPEEAKSGQVTVEVNGKVAHGLNFEHTGSLIFANGRDNALFNRIDLIIADSKGNIFVHDNNLIKKISPTGEIDVFAGGGKGSLVNGIGKLASFNRILGLAIDKYDNLLVSESSSKLIRKITPQAEVSTLTELPFNPNLMKSDFMGNVLISDSNGRLYFFDVNSGQATLVKGFESKRVRQFAIVDKNEFYFNDTNKPRQIQNYKNNVITTVATDKLYRWIDGPLDVGSVMVPIKMTFNNINNNLFFLDGVRGVALRKIVLGSLLTLSGLNGSGFEVGSLGRTKMSRPNDICIDRKGNVYVSDPGNKVIYKFYSK
ncbi:IPT/TIG domain-containing protein [Sphingobacterium lactis]|uniref:IPT/TIG domain-containing protein n=1 Tax=Sphingobacterium lactis TaxID=797291 RepID=UPI003F7EDDC0